MRKPTSPYRYLVVGFGAAMVLGGCVSSGSDSSDSSEDNDTQQPEEEQTTAPPTSEGQLVLTNSQSDRDCRAKGVRVVGHNASGELVLDTTSGDAGTVDISSVPEDGFVGVVTTQDQGSLSHVARDSIRSWHEWEVSVGEQTLCESVEPTERASVTISNKGSFERVDVSARLASPGILALGFGKDDALDQYAYDTQFPASGETKELTINQTPNEVTLDMARTIEEVETALFVDDFVYQMASLDTEPKKVFTPAIDGQLYLTATVEKFGANYRARVSQNKTIDNATASSVSVGGFDPLELDNVSVSDGSLSFDFTVDLNQFPQKQAQFVVQRQHKGVDQVVLYRPGNTLSGVDGQAPLLAIPDDMKNAGAGANSLVDARIDISPDLAERRNVYRLPDGLSWITMNDERYSSVYEDRMALMEALYMPNTIRFMHSTF